MARRLPTAATPQISGRERRPDQLFRDRHRHGRRVIREVNWSSDRPRAVTGGKGGNAGLIGNGGFGGLGGDEGKPQSKNAGRRPGNGARRQAAPPARAALSRVTVGVAATAVSATAILRSRRQRRHGGLDRVSWHRRCRRHRRHRQRHRMNGTTAVGKGSVERRTRRRATVRRRGWRRRSGHRDPSAWAATALRAATHIVRRHGRYRRRWTGTDETVTKALGGGHQRHRRGRRSGGGGLFGGAGGGGAPVPGSIWHWWRRSRRRSRSLFGGKGGGGGTGTATGMVSVPVGPTPPADSADCGGSGLFGGRGGNGGDATAPLRTQATEAAAETERWLAVAAATAAPGTTPVATFNARW